MNETCVVSLRYWLPARTTIWSVPGCWWFTEMLILCWGTSITSWAHWTGYRARPQRGTQNRTWSSYLHTTARRTTIGNKENWREQKYFPIISWKVQWYSVIHQICSWLKKTTVFLARAHFHLLTLDSLNWILTIQITNKLNQCLTCQK